MTCFFCLFVFSFFGGFFGGGAKNWYQFLTPVNNWHKFLIQVKNLLIISEKNW